MIWYFQAKLDQVNVDGSCDCGKKTETIIIKDYVLVLDSSDSFGETLAGGVSALILYIVSEA